MVLFSDTRVDPWTVVVESFDAAVADCTVLAALGAENATLWTDLARVDVFKQF